MASDSAENDLTFRRGDSLNQQMERTEQPARRSPWLLPVLFAPVFMVILDVFIVNVTAPSLHADLGATDSDLQWVVAGQIVGGGLIALDLLGLGWRWVFLINVPVGLIALLCADRVIPESRSESAKRIDLVGVALATVTLSLVMVPAVEGREVGWPA